MEIVRRSALGLPLSRRWPFVLVGGLGLWIAALAVTNATSDALLIPTDLALGAALVPATMIVWNFERRADEALSGARVAATVVAGGVASILITVPPEKAWVEPGVTGWLLVGAIEEGAKLSVLAIAAAGLSRYTTRDGVILGAALGFGFAAFESSGYALTALANPSPFTRTPLASLVEMEALRNLQAPFTHGLWTGLAGGVLFWAVSRRRPHRVLGVVSAYLFVAALHAFWNLADEVARALLPAVARRGLDVAALVPATVETSNLLTFNAIWVLLVGISSGLGLGVLLLLWRAGRPRLS